jgi:hypothetical protein
VRRAESSSMKDRKVYVNASNLRLINIGQLIEVVAAGVTTMGKLERVKFLADGHVTLRVSGDTVVVPTTHQVNIRRSPELHELRLASLGVEDLVDVGVGV